MVACLTQGRNPSSLGGIQTPYELSATPLHLHLLLLALWFFDASSHAGLTDVPEIAHVWLFSARIAVPQCPYGSVCSFFKSHTALSLSLWSGVTFLGKPSLATLCKSTLPSLLSFSVQHLSPSDMLHMFYFYLFIKKSIKAGTWPCSWLCART